MDSNGQQTTVSLEMLYDNSRIGTLSDGAERARLAVRRYSAPDFTA